MATNKPENNNNDEQAVYDSTTENNVSLEHLKENHYISQLAQPRRTSQNSNDEEKPEDN